MLFADVGVRCLLLSQLANAVCCLLVAVIAVVVFACWSLLFVCSLSLLFAVVGVCLSS